MLQIGCLRNSRGLGGGDLLHSCAQTKLSVIELGGSEHLISGRVFRSNEGGKKSDFQ